MKNIFCAKCQEVTPHKGTLSPSGEFVFHCQNVMEEDGYGRQVGHSFLKFPADTTPEQLDELIQKERENAEGQVSVEAQEARLAEMLDGPVDGEVEVEGENSTENTEDTEETQPES
jgi:hypothetical protein